MDEFDLIAKYFTDISPDTVVKGQSVTLGVGDDCALLKVPAGMQLAMSMDTLVAGRHFPLDAKPYDIATRAIAVSVSDLAAMGALPVAFTLGLTLPEADSEWLKAFSAGLKVQAEHYGMALIGGDTTRGPLSITVQVHGLLPEGRALQRSAAQVGDGVFVSETLGNGAAALAVIENKISVNDDQRSELLEHFYQPDAQIMLGMDLLDLAHAAVDISDGLLADAGHIAKASKVAIDINVDQLPLSETIRQLFSSSDAITMALSGGDDYQLCFTAPPEHFESLQTLATQLGLLITQIGEVRDGEGVSCINSQGEQVKLTSSGYQHF